MTRPLSFGQTERQTRQCIPFIDIGSIKKLVSGYPELVFSGWSKGEVVP